jgi:hypothetical protein
MTFDEKRQLMENSLIRSRKKQTLERLCNVELSENVISNMKKGF